MLNWKGPQGPLSPTPGLINLTGTPPDPLGE